MQRVENTHQIIKRQNKRYNSKLIPDQFNWEQNDERITITLNNKYFEFCWHASSTVGIFPPITKKDIKLIIQRQSIILELPQFCVPAFQGILEQMILSDESTWDFIPDKGIVLYLQKRIQNKPWNQPFSSFEKEISQIDLQNTRAEFRALDPNFRFDKILEQQSQFMNQFNESFERLKNNSFNTDFYMDNFLKLQEGFQQYPQQRGISNNGFLTPDVVKKQKQFSKVLYSSMQPMFMKDMEFGISYGKFIFVQTLSSSLQMQSLRMLITDPYDTTNNLSIYGLSNQNIKEGTWLLIKEPFFKFGARDHTPFIRIDDLDELIIFADDTIFNHNRVSLQFNESIDKLSAQRIENVFNQQFQCIIYDFLPKKLSFTILTFYSKKSNFENGEPIIYIQQNSEMWIAGVIDQMNVVSQNCYEITLQDTVQSELFLDCLKNKIEKRPGEAILLWKYQNTNYIDILEYLYYTNKIPLTLLDECAKKIEKSQIEKCKYIVSDLLNIFNNEKDDLFCMEQTKKYQKQNKENQQLQDIKEMQKKAICQQITDILNEYECYINNKKQQKTFIEPVDKSVKIVKMNNNNFINKTEQLKKQSFHSFENILIDPIKVFNKLKQQSDQEIINTSLFYLKSYYDYLNQENQFITTQEYANLVIKKKICQKEFHINIVQKSLELIGFYYEHKVIERFMKQLEKKRISKKKRIQQKKAQNLKEELQIIQTDSAIQFLEDEEQIQEIIQEFISNDIIHQQDQEDLNQRLEDDFDDLPQPNHKILTDQEQISEQKIQSNNQGNKQELKDDQSIQSLLTVHSRANNQKSNIHWKQRLEERFKIDANDESIKQEILFNMKQLMKDESTQVIQSKNDQNRYLVKDVKNNIQFVLTKTKEVVDGKSVYVPITVLSNKMKFN